MPAEKHKNGSGAWSDGTWARPGSALVFGSATGVWRAPKWYNTNNSADDGSDHLRPRPWTVHGGGGGNLRWKPISEGDHKLCVLVTGILRGTLTVNGEQGRINGYNGKRAVFRFSQPGRAYGTNVKVVLNGGSTWTIPNGASSLKNFKSDSAKAPVKATWEMTPEGYGTRTNLIFDHWNWSAHGIGAPYAMVTTTKTNGAEWIEVGGHRMEKHGSQDKYRDVWKMGTLKQTGTLFGRIKIGGKIYTFKIPRGNRLVYNINLHGSSKHGSGKPTNKPTSKQGGAADSKNLYGQEHGGDVGGWTDTQPGPDGWPGTGSSGKVDKYGSGLDDIPDAPPGPSEPGTGHGSGDHHGSGGADAVGEGGVGT